MVTVLGASGLTNAYRSVLSRLGVLAIRGASRCEEALPDAGARVTRQAAATPSAPTESSLRRASNRTDLIFPPQTYGRRRQWRRFASGSWRQSRRIRY